MDTQVIRINGRLYRIAKTLGGEPSVYRATSFTAVGPPLSMPPQENGISYSMGGDFILAVLEEIVQ